MFEVRRDDGELCGFVVAADGRWSARTVFGDDLALHADPMTPNARSWRGPRVAR